MKKQLLLFVMMVLPFMASAHDIEVTNSDGVTIYYNYINNGTELEVTFRGSYYNDYSNEYQGNVAIPEEVTYMNRTRMVTSIGNYAFYYCSKLTSVTIPNSVTSIGGWAFEGCSGLTSVTIPNSVTSIELGTFSGCSGLTSITIPNSVEYIGSYAFYYCSKLTSITIPKSVTSIGDEAFDGVDLTTVVSLIENPFVIVGKSSSSRDFSVNTFENATLYVPVGTIDKYKATDGWKDFAYIVEGTPTGIKVIENTQNKNATVYDLNGVRLSEPKKGINIINGQKVIVK